MSTPSRTASLLVELFVEELPPKSLKKLGNAFAETLFTWLKTQHILGPNSTFSGFASPRRLAVHVTGVLPLSVPQQQRVKLMPVSVAKDASGKWTTAMVRKAQGFAVPEAEWEQVFEVASDGKQDCYFFTRRNDPFPLQMALQVALDIAIEKLPIPKVMTYQLADGWSDVKFVRPAHALVALHGADVVPVQALGLRAGRETHGHRFEAAMDPVVLQDADHYDRQMQDQGAVIPGFADRRNEIVRQLQAAAAAVGLRPIEDEALLDEVTALVERPHVLTCHFEPAFLGVPQECLILTMKANQKYFPLLDAQGKLTNAFLVVSNIRPDP